MVTIRPQASTKNWSTVRTRDPLGMVQWGTWHLSWGTWHLSNDIDGIYFEQAWPRRTEVWIEHQSESISYAYIGLDDLIENKRASGRAKDVDDLPYLIAAGKARSSDE